MPKLCQVRGWPCTVRAPRTHEEHVTGSSPGILPEGKQIIQTCPAEHAAILMKEGELNYMSMWKSIWACAVLMVLF